MNHAALIGSETSWHILQQYGQREAIAHSQHITTLTDNNSDKVSALSQQHKGEKNHNCNDIMKWVLPRFGRAAALHVSEFGLGREVI